MDYLGGLNVSVRVFMRRREEQRREKKRRHMKMTESDVAGFEDRGRPHEARSARNF